MKKIVFLAIAMFMFSFANAQTDEGTLLVEANTGFGAFHPSNTGFYLTSIDGNTAWNIGLEGGYFIMDDLAIKAGLGYGDDGNEFTSSVFSYKIGAKYYVSGQIPLQIDLNGASIEDADENPMYLGLQAGYAVFLTDNISLEPGLRYDLSLNENFSDHGILAFNVGFALFF